MEYRKENHIFHCRKRLIGQISDMLVIRETETFTCDSFSFIFVLITIHNTHLPSHLSMKVMLCTVNITLHMEILSSTFLAGFYPW